MVPALPLRAGSAASLSVTDARSLTDQVKADAQALWEKLLDLYVGGAHLVLDYSSWGGYCAAEFGMSDGRAYQLLQSARVIDQLTTVSPPQNERQARELAPLLRTEPEAIPIVWQEVQERAAEQGRPATAVDIREAVERRIEKPHVAHNTGENEWYTPPDYLEAARAAMGSIDVDPASAAKANERVGAAVFYDTGQNGLTQTWHGNVWMNPPYAQPLISQFADALVEKFSAGEVDQACVLVNNATETAWCQRLIACASALCFVRGRVRFLTPDGCREGAPLQGQIVLYLGGRPEAFSAHFAQLGQVWIAQ